MGHLFLFIGYKVPNTEIFQGKVGTEQARLRDHQRAHGNHIPACTPRATCAISGSSRWLPAGDGAIIWLHRRKYIAETTSSIRSCGRRSPGPCLHLQCGGARQPGSQLPRVEQFEEKHPGGAGEPGGRSEAWPFRLGWPPISPPPSTSSGQGRGLAYRRYFTLKAWKPLPSAEMPPN